MLKSAGVFFVGVVASVATATAQVSHPSQPVANVLTIPRGTRMTQPCDYDRCTLRLTMRFFATGNFASGVERSSAFKARRPFHFVSNEEGNRNPCSGATRSPEALLGNDRQRH